jgi:putative tricarboxylic transport membrane protein
MRLTQNGVAGLVCLALSIALLMLARGLPQSSFVPVGPDFYPRIVLVLMAVLSAMLVLADFWPKRPQEETPGAAPAPEKRNYRLVVVTYTVFTGYVILLPLTGYRLATFVFVAALQAVLAPPRAARQWVAVLVAALVSAAVTYIVFDGYLSVLLPRGRWTGW